MQKRNSLAVKDQFQIQPHQQCLFHPRAWKSWKLGPIQVVNEIEEKLYQGQQKAY